MSGKYTFRRLSLTLAIMILSNCSDKDRQFESDDRLNQAEVALGSKIDRTYLRRIVIGWPEISPTTFRLSAKERGNKTFNVKDKSGRVTLYKFSCRTVRMTSIGIAYACELNLKDVDENEDRSLLVSAPLGRDEDTEAKFFVSSGKANCKDKLDMKRIFLRGIEINISPKRLSKEYDDLHLEVSIKNADRNILSNLSAFHLPSSKSVQQQNVDMCFESKKEISITCRSPDSSFRKCNIEDYYRPYAWEAITRG